MYVIVILKVLLSKIVSVIICKVKIKDQVFLLIDMTESSLAWGVPGEKFSNVRDTKNLDAQLPLLLVSLQSTHIIREAGISFVQWICKEQNDNSRDLKFQLWISSFCLAYVRARNIDPAAFCDLQESYSPSAEGLT